MDKNAPLQAQHAPKKHGVDKAIPSGYNGKCIPTQGQTISVQFIILTGEIAHEQDQDALHHLRQVVSVG
jgi:hypothetical protein